MTYWAGSTPLGDLAYMYDLVGRRASVTGSFARTGLPEAVSATAYNANNQLTQWGAATRTYDANGNLLSDGSNNFSWDGRNQLVAMNQGGAVFQYDALGRRLGKTLLGTATNYLYDGLNVIQELDGTMPAANLLAGGIDEYFTRTDAAGTASFLPDALGSTLALMDATGAMQTQYTYEPFGRTTVGGASTANSFAYTGRELDGTGLYYYRARYYDPMIGRFVSEDPIGFDGGDNFYAYAANDATGLADPLGLAPGDWWDPRSYSYSSMFTKQNAWDTLKDVGTASEAFADALTLGSASRLNNALGAGGMVDRCGIGHKLGSASGIVASIALGGAMGAEAAEANAGKKGFEFSHWLPDRMGGPRILENGNWPSIAEHALNDPFRYRFMPAAWKALNPMNPAWLQQLNRIPLLLRGAAAGAAYGGAGAMAGRNCGCH